MKTAHFLKMASSILGLSLYLIIYPIASQAGVVDIHFVELDGGGIDVKVFFSGVFPPPPPPANFTTLFPGESASIAAAGALHIGNRFGVPLLFNVLEVAGGPISGQVSVTTGATVISFISDGPGSPPFSTAVPTSEIVEDGTGQFVGSYIAGDNSTKVNLFVQSAVEPTSVPVPATLALLVLGLGGIGFSRRKAL